MNTFVGQQLSTRVQAQWQPGTGTELIEEAQQAGRRTRWQGDSSNSDWIHLDLASGISKRAVPVATQWRDVGGGIRRRGWLRLLEGCLRLPEGWLRVA